MANRSIASGKVTAKIQATVQNTMDDGSVASGPVLINIDETVASGIQQGEANRAWQWIHTDTNAKTIASGGTFTIDVADLGGNPPRDMGAGSGNDIVGQSLTLQEVVSILIKNANAAGTDGNLEIEPHGNQGWSPIGSHTVANGGALGAQGFLLKHNPSLGAFPITAGSNHRILLSANGGAINLSVAILGRSDSDESSSSSSESSSSSSSVSSSSSSSVSSSSSSQSLSTSSSSQSLSTSSSSPSSFSRSTSSASSSSSASSNSSSSSSSSVS